MATSGIIDKLNASNGPKPYSHAWKYVEEFDLVQAAHLWCGCEPKTFYTKIAGDDPPSELQAYLTMLEAAERSGELKTDRPTGPHAWMGGPYTTPPKATRATLVAFAESKNLYPAFLFDTVLSPADESGDEFEDGPSFADKTSGKTPKYNWDRISAIAIILELDEGLPSGFMEICRRIHSFIEKDPTDFCSKGTRAPDLSQIQKKCGGLINQFIELRDKFNKAKQ